MRVIWASHGKSDDSPLTKADLASHELIQAELSRRWPEIPVLSEESADIPWETRQNWTQYWLVDPLDGTKEFINRNGEFTVNIALIRDHRPVMGIVHVPVTDTSYYGAQDLAPGASKAQRERSLFRPDAPLHNRQSSLEAVHTPTLNSRASCNSLASMNWSAWVVHLSFVA